jgi:hypothetical protein
MVLKDVKEAGAQQAGEDEPINQIVDHFPVAAVADGRSRRARRHYQKGRDERRRESENADRHAECIDFN